ncbi:polysaccharide biosynthesis protein [Sphingobacterium endophyticum]|uniref:polysaccharide biosynthesis protein n=1 Tax=Sphingobacterium endophyticum TaxID=2546448 RepID=UPI001E63DFEF|nr:polysaccharide biosynthesis protein [Sphingobacterium endophyticum]
MSEPQLKHGGHFTLTHITRYFMTIPLASQLDQVAIVVGRESEIYVFDTIFFNTLFMKPWTSRPQDIYIKA